MTNKEIEIPRLTDDAAYTAAHAKLTELQVERNRLEKVCNEILGDINSPKRSPESPIVSAAKRLLSGESAIAKTSKQQENYADYQSRITVLDEAIRMQRRIVGKELSRASMQACEQMQPAHKDHVRQIVAALKVLDAALASEKGLRFDLVDAGYAVSTLRPMPINHLGLLRDPYSRAAAYLLECAEFDFIDGGELPKHLREFLPVPPSVSKAKTALEKVTDGWIG